MKINQIIISEMTTAGSIATVAKPVGKTQTRSDIRGLQPAEKVMKGKAKKKGPYANSLVEGKVKELAMDLKGGRDGLNDAEFKKKYGKTKEEMRKDMAKKPEPVKEAKLDEDDIILVPGQGMKRKTGFVQHGQSRVDHEVEMAKSDLFQLLKNTKTVLMVVKDMSEDDGLEGWVQEKIIKASDYMNTLAEYFEGKGMSEEITSGGVIAGGGVGEGVAEGSGSNTQSHADAFKSETDTMKPGTKKYVGRKDGKEVHAKKDAQGNVKFYHRDGIKGPLKGVAEGEYNPDTFVGKKGMYKGYGITQEGPHQWGISSSVRKFPTLNAAKRHIDKNLVLEQGVAEGYIPSAGELARDLMKLDDVKFTEKYGMSKKEANMYYSSSKLKEQGVAEGAKVDRMVKHIAKSERGLGHSKKEAENIAWSTANKRGMLDNKNKKVK